MKTLEETMKELEECIARLKKNDPSLTKLNLENDSIGDEGAVALAEALKINNTLTNLYLRGNAIEDEGAIAFDEVLKINQNLTITFDRPWTMF